MAVSEGRDPYLEKRKKTEPTFGEACAIVVENKRKTWSNPREAHDWLRSFENYAYPLLGDKLASEVGPSDVLDVLLPMWTAKPTSAKRVRMRIGAVMKWAAKFTNSSNRVRCSMASAMSRAITISALFFPDVTGGEKPELRKLVDSTKILSGTADSAETAVA